MLIDSPRDLGAWASVKAILVQPSGYHADYGDPQSEYVPTFQEKFEFTDRSVYLRHWGMSGCTSRAETPGFNPASR